MPHSAFRIPHFAFAAILLALTSLARALEPGEIAVLCNTRNDQSLAVANYYMHARGIPHENLIDLNCSPLQRISELDYRTVIVPTVRKAIKDRNLDGKIKCLVPVLGVPLIIDAAQLDSITHQEVEADKKQFADVLTQLNAAVTDYETLAGGTPTSQPAKPAATPPSHADEQLELHNIIEKLNAAGTDASTRIATLSTADRAAAVERLLQLHMKVAGLNGCLSIIRVSEDTPHASLAYARRDSWQAELNTLDARLQELAKQKLTRKTRQEIIDLQSRARGLVGEATQIESTISDLTPEETEAAFDNELALVFADQDYPRYRWIVNASSLDLYQTLKKFPQFPRPIMVSRIDGASIDQVTHMIDTTLKVERTGLEGKIYLDARGLHGTDGYAVFDADIRRAADWLTSNADINVVLDDSPGLLEAKNCSNAALYCGWYSLHHYVDSCQWLPGAVGYHVASFEMPSLHDPNETGWVPNLLKRGFCGTLGAVNEPYLIAFPKPSQFFPLLLSGQFTQGEVWQVTMPFSSWRIAYVGDPLYNPYKVHPRVKVETLQADTVLRNAFEILGR